MLRSWRRWRAERAWRRYLKDRDEMDELRAFCLRYGDMTVPLSRLYRKRYRLR